MGRIEQMTGVAGQFVHEGAQDSWTAVYEMLALQRRFAELTRAQTARKGLSLLGDQGPVATLGCIDHAIEHLGILVELLEGCRHRVELSVSGAVDRALVGALR